jgi:hypothetical protein
MCWSFAKLRERRWLAQYPNQFEDTRQAAELHCNSHLACDHSIGWVDRGCDCRWSPLSNDLGKVSTREPSRETLLRCETRSRILRSSSQDATHIQPTHTPCKGSASVGRTQLADTLVIGMGNPRENVRGQKVRHATSCKGNERTACSSVSYPGAGQERSVNSAQSGRETREKSFLRSPGYF